MRHVALIDIGSNTIRLVSYELDGEHVTRLFSKKRMTGLADYVGVDGRLGAEGIDEACEAIAYLQRLCEKLGVDAICPFATASLRNVTNSKKAIKEIEKRTGLRIDLVSEKDEALLGYAAFLHDAPFADGGLVDIGGGSTELVSFSGGVPETALSLPVGSLKLFKRHVAGILPSPAEAAAVKADIESELDRALPDGLAPARHICGIGGSARAVLKLVRRMHGMPESTQEFSAAKLDELVETLCAGGEGDGGANEAAVGEADGAATDEAGIAAGGALRRARKLILRSCPDRVHTIVPGALVLQAVVGRFGAERIYVSKYGIREGYLHERVLPRETAAKA